MNALSRREILAARLPLRSPLPPWPGRNHLPARLESLWYAEHQALLDVALGGQAHMRLAARSRDVERFEALLARRLAA